MFTKKFWKDAIERAIKTIAQAQVAILTSGVLGLLNVDWVALLSVSGLAGLVSILTSIASAGASNSDSASLVR